MNVIKNGTASTSKIDGVRVCMRSWRDPITGDLILHVQTIYPTDGVANAANNAVNAMRGTAQNYHNAFNATHTGLRSGAAAATVTAGTIYETNK